MKRLAIGLMLCALAAPSWAKEGDSVREQLEALALQYGIDPNPAFPKEEPGKATQPEKKFFSWFARTPDFSRLDGFWTLVSEVQNHALRCDEQGLKTETGLDRTLMVSVTGKKSERTFTSIALGQNLNSINRKDVQEDHRTSTVEFDISDKFMVFTIEERFFDGMMGFSSFKTWTHRYLCRNYKHATRLVCHIKNKCVSSENKSCGESVSFQDFVRAEKK